MKKIITLFLNVLCCIVCTMSAAYAMTEVSAMNDIYYIRGQLESNDYSYGSKLTVILKDGTENTPQNILYIDEIKINSDGSYSAAFPIKPKESANIKAFVKAGKKNASQSIIYAGTFDDMVNSKLVRAADSNAVKVYAEVRNYYKSAWDYKLIAAAYDNGKLVEIKAQDVSLRNNDSMGQAVFSFDKDNITEVSLMIWDNIKPMTPMCKKIAGNDFITESTPDYTKYRLEETERTEYLKISNVDLSHIQSGFMTAGSQDGNQQIDIILDSPDGELVGRIKAEATGSEWYYKDVEFEIKSVYGIHNLYFKKAAGCNIKNITLSNQTVSTSSGAAAPVFVDNSDNNIVYTGEWTDKSGEFYYDGSARTAEKGASVKHAFYGTGIDIISDVTPTDCNVDIYIDGVFEKSLNLKNLKNQGSAVESRTVFTKTDMPRWKHTIEIISHNGGFVLDAFKVYTRPIRILCVGDSITAGKADMNWPDELQKILGDGYYVMNAGAAGYKTTDYMEHIIAPTAKNFDADIIINTMGYNDFGQTSDFSAEDFGQNFMNLMETMAQTCTTVPRKYIGLVPFATSATENGKNQTAGIAELKKLAQEKNLPIIDFNTYMKPYQDSTYYWPDKTHPYVIESTRMLAEIAAGQILCSELSDTEAIKAAVKLNENPQYPGKTN